MKKFYELKNFINHIRNIYKVPYTLRAYAKGLEKILEPIIKKMIYIENKVKNLGIFVVLYLFIHKLLLLYYKG